MNNLIPILGILAFLSHLVSGEDIYENPFHNHKPEDFKGYTGNYVEQFEYSENNVTTNNITSTIISPTSKPKGFQHFINRQYSQFSNPSSSWEGNFTSFSDIINDRTTRTFQQRFSSVLGLPSSQFVYADGTPEGKYIKKGEEWNVWMVTISHINYHGKYWNVISNVTINRTVEGLKSHYISGLGWRNLLNIKQEVYATYEFWDYRKMVGAIDGYMPSYYLTPTKIYECINLYSKNMGSIYQSGLFVGLDPNHLTTIGDDTEGIKAFSGFTTDEIAEQVLSLYPKFKYKFWLKSTTPRRVPEGFETLTYSEVSSGASHIDAWTWNGAFPWVYNANTGSWFYYRFRGNICYAYDVRSSKWFAFDESNGGWRLAQ